ncbi:MAG TPA: sugar ABC transporter permease [Acidimicrobiales bacterium]|nr:sugar ABC transporter permease [Acidimicrobiales bacterium]
MTATSVARPARGTRRERAAPGLPGGRVRSGTGRLRRERVGYWFILPTVAFFVVFLAYPLIRSFYISLHSWPGFGPEKWVGFRNFSAMFKDQVWRQSLVNTLIFTAATTVITTALAMVVAAVLKAGWRFGVVFRVAIFIPALLSLVVSGTLWGLIYEPSFGILDQFLRSVGLHELSTSWLSNSHTVLPSIIVVSIWQSVGFFMLIFYAGLQDIDPELYEAARIDGASVVSQFRHVTVPMLRTVTSIVVTLNLINGLKTFDVIYVMTGGGPDHASDSLTTYLYSLAFGGQVAGAIPLIGYATAIGVLVLVLAVIIVSAQLAISARRRVTA